MALYYGMVSNRYTHYTRLQKTDKTNLNVIYKLKAVVILVMTTDQSNPSYFT